MTINADLWINYEALGSLSTCTTYTCKMLTMRTYQIV